ncbi:MAG: hypothetical protein M3290_03360 [Actinomycetota bacterium]|nr:hypothetical protein [Actinomycetota bacterium]
MRNETRWLISILVGLAAMIGMLILVFLVAVALEPPTWLQILLGVAIVAGGIGLTSVVWLALADRQERHFRVMGRSGEGERNNGDVTTAR